MIICFTLFCISKCNAEDITFEESTASNMVVELEQCKVIKDQIELYKQSNSELEYQIKLQKDINNLQKEQLEIAKDTVKQYQELIKNQKEVYTQLIKDAKPNPIKKLLDSLGFIGIGILAVTLL